MCSATSPRLCTESIPAPTTAKLAVGLLLLGARRKRQVDWIVSRDCTLMVRAYRICDGQYMSANVSMRQESLTHMEVMSTSCFGRVDPGPSPLDALYLVSTAIQPFLTACKPLFRYLPTHFNCLSAHFDPLRTLSDPRSPPTDPRQVLPGPR